MIRIDAAWLATAPLDMRAGTDTAWPGWSPSSALPTPPRLRLCQPARQPHQDPGARWRGVWLAARRLHQGKFVWTAARQPQPRT